MPLSLRPNRSPRRGAAAVEMAVVTPLLFMLILGILEFGRMLMVQEVLVNGAREGARRAVLTGSTKGDVETVIDNYMTGATINKDKVTTTISPDMTGLKAGDPVTVTVEVPFSDVSWIPGVSFFGLNDVKMKSSVIMRKE
jgi:Flp pilus assembly protein TadG